MALARYQLPTGKALSPLAVAADEVPLGMDKAGEHLFMLRWFDLRAGAIDVDTGKVEWSVDYASLVRDKTLFSNMPLTTCLSDASGIVLQFSDKIVALNSEGKEMWRLVPPTGHHWAVATAEPVLDDGCVVVRDPEASAVIGVSSKDGKELWRVAERKGSTVLAFSHRSQMVATLDGQAIRLVPVAASSREVIIKGVDAKSEAKFSPDGKMLIIVPGLQMGSPKPPVGTEPSRPVLFRTSAIARIIDTATGKQMQQIDIGQGTVP